MRWIRLGFGVSSSAQAELSMQPGSSLLPGSTWWLCPARHGSPWGREMSWGSGAGSLVHGFATVSGVSAPALLPRPRALLPCAGSRDLGAD